MCIRDRGETPIVHSLRSFTHGFSPYNPSSLGGLRFARPRAADAALESCTQQSCENTCNGGGVNSLINKQVHIIIEQCIKQWLQFFECVYRVNTVSYTHLDVYKRQVLGISSRMSESRFLAR